jgi:hypothetical protein
MKSPWIGLLARIGNTQLKKVSMKPLLYILFLLVPSTFGFANIIHVPAQAPTIQQGMDLAQTGDTVLVAEGHYYEQISFKGKAITVASEFIMDGDTSHISKTIIDGSQHVDPDSGSVVYFVNGETKNSVLYGFTITGGSGTLLKGMYFYYDNSLTEYYGGGIKIWAGGTIEHNRIIYNAINRSTVKEGAGWGGGIDTFGWNNTDTIIIRNNEISHNTINAWWGGAAGVDMTTKGYTLFENNIVEENICNSSGGLYCACIAVAGSYDFNGKIIISGNLIRENVSSQISGDNRMGGGGIWIQDCSPEVINNIIMENTTTGNGGGISSYYHGGIYGKTKSILMNNTIINNTALTGGGIYIFAASYGDNIPIIFNTIVWGNTATIDPGICLDGIVHLYHSLIQDSMFNNINNGVFCTNPRFADSLSHLNNQSPCLGSGTSSLYINDTLYRAPSTDITGNPRPSSVDTLIDIGAYESDYAALAFPTSFNLSSIFVPPTPGTMHFTSEILNLHQQAIHAFSKICTDDGSSRDSVELFDDGQHGDGQAGDGLFGASYQTAMEDIFTTGVAVQNSSKDIRFEYGDNQKFTTIGPVVYKGYTIVTSGDGNINPGETHRIKLELQNLGQTATATKIQARITPLDTFITLVNNGFLFNDILAGQTALSTNYRTLKFSKNIPGPIDTVCLAIDITSDGYTFWRDTTFKIVVVVGIESEQPTLPVVYSLEQNYPNPFNPTTTIKYQIPKSNHVTLKVFDLLGREVATLVDGMLDAGYYDVNWNAEHFASGIYVYRLQTERFVESKKLILLK